MPWENWREFEISEAQPIEARFFASLRSAQNDFVASFAPLREII
jgi:hypothetical protein